MCLGLITLFRRFFDSLGLLGRFPVQACFHCIHHSHPDHRLSCPRAARCPFRTIAQVRSGGDHWCSTMLCCRLPGPKDPACGQDLLIFVPEYEDLKNDNKWIILGKFILRRKAIFCPNLTQKTLKLEVLIV
jgi:hypothetical protein